MHTRTDLQELRELAENATYRFHGPVRRANGQLYIYKDPFGEDAIACFADVDDADYVSACAPENLLPILNELDLLWHKNKILMEEAQWLAEELAKANGEISEYEDGINPVYEGNLKQHAQDLRQEAHNAVAARKGVQLML